MVLCYNSLDRLRHLPSCKNRYMQNLIHNSPKLETIQTSFSRWLVKQPVVHTYQGMLLSNKREQMIDTATTRVNFQGVMLSGKNISL